MYALVMYCMKRLSQELQNYGFVSFFISTDFGKNYFPFLSITSYKWSSNLKTDTFKFTMKCVSACEPCSIPLRSPVVWLITSCTAPLLFLSFCLAQVRKVSLLDLYVAHLCLLLQQRCSFSVFMLLFQLSRLDVKYRPHLCYLRHQTPCKLRRKSQKNAIVA